MSVRIISIFLALVSMTMVPLVYSNEATLYQPKTSAVPAAPSAPSAAEVPVGPTASQAFNEDGRQCTLITFEGVGNLAPIPVFDGISSPGWQGLIDADAGGDGNFANEPSPQTISFWLGGDPGSKGIIMSVSLKTKDNKEMLRQTAL